MFTVHTYLFMLPFPECHGSQCALMALKTKEPSNCKLQQSLCQWKQWITDTEPGMSCGSTLHVSPMCHVTWLLPWWASMYKKGVKSSRRHPAILQSYPCPWMYFESFHCQEHCDWLLLWNSCWKEEGRKSLWRSWKKMNYTIPYVEDGSSSVLKIAVSFKITSLNCFSGITVCHVKEKKRGGGFSCSKTKDDAR